MLLTRCANQTNVHPRMSLGQASIFAERKEPRLQLRGRCGHTPVLPHVGLLAPAHQPGVICDTHLRPQRDGLTLMHTSCQAKPNAVDLETSTLCIALNCYLFGTSSLTTHTRFYNKLCKTCQAWSLITS